MQIPVIGFWSLAPSTRWDRRSIGSRRTTFCHGPRFPNILRRPEPLTFEAVAMERRVKERLVGATILAVLIVLIVPELLSGPPTAPVGPKLPVSAPEPVRNVTVDLATAKPPVIEPANPAPVPAPQPPGTPSGAAERTEAGGGATAGAGATTGAAATDAATTDAGAAAGAGAVPGDATPSA